MRSIGVTLISLALTFSVMGNAYYQKKQFYPSVVYITKSNPCMAVIYIQAFILVLLIGKLMRKIFFGQLRAAEFEHLIERSWYAVTETCLAFTVFRDDFNPKFVALFTVLLFLKSFHWLAEDRVDYMERSPIISWLFHARVLTLLSLLGALDLVSIEYAYLSTLTRGPSVQLVFGFEYAILLTMVVSVLVKYILHTLDLNSETPSENKAVFLLYTELVIGLIKVLLYVSFVVIMVRIYTLPLFAFRPMYYTMRNFKKAFNDVILSRRAIRNMNTLYPDATPAELQAADNVCIICREEMLTASKKLPCNHIFHTACLRSWFQRQQTCPTCRLNILRPTPAVNRNVPAPAAAGQQQQPQQARPAQPQPPQPPGGNILGAGVNPFQFLAGPNPFQAAGANIRPPTTSATNPSAPSTSASPPPFLFPPFPFMPFTVPPPIPPPNLSQLTEEELRKLEGVERQNVEARIQLLRNIQLMLDTSVIMMQQYLTAAATTNTTQRNVVDTNTEARNVVDQAGDVPVNADEMENSSEANSEPSTSKEASNKEETNAVVNGERNDEFNEIRRRRLQRFQNNTDAQ